MPSVSLREVSKLFGETVAVESASFDVDDGELLVLLGPSGCGKTTTLRLIAGLEEPDSGEITIGSRLISSTERGVFVPTEKRGIGMVFQSYAIWPHMTVLENVAYPLRLRRMPGQEVRERVRQVLELVGLGGLESRGATRLSGGQQQRVALARAIVFQPSLLLLDEPLSNLDAKLRVHMRAELKSLQQKTGITTIYVTHDQDESMALADRIIVMNQGRIEQMGTPEEVYERPRTNFVADFVGASNLLDAQVIGAQEADGYVHLAIGEPRQTIHCLPPTDGERLEKGQWVLVSLRPEKLGLHVEPPPGAVNVWECRVEAAMYSGDHREYQLSVGDQVLKVSAPVSPALAKGDNVYAVIDPREPVLLAAEGAP